MASTLAAAVQGARSTRPRALSQGSAFVQPDSNNTALTLSVSPRHADEFRDVEAGTFGTHNSEGFPNSANPNLHRDGSKAADKAGSGSNPGGFSVHTPPGWGSKHGRSSGGGGLNKSHPAITAAATAAGLTPSRGRMRCLSAVMASPAFGYGLGPMLADVAREGSRDGHVRPNKDKGSAAAHREPDRSPLRGGYDLLAGSSHSDALQPPQQALSPVLPALTARPSSQSLRSFLARRSAASLSLQHAEPSWHEVHLPMSLRVRLCRDAAAGVAYLHSCGVMHCDIKSLNFLVDADLVLKLADLGEARRTHAPQHGSGVDGLDPSEGGERERKEGASSGSWNSRQSHNSGMGRRDDPRLFPQNVNWSAPEVMQVTLSTMTSLSSRHTSAASLSLGADPRGAPSGVLPDTARGALDHTYLRSHSSSPFAYEDEHSRGSAGSIDRSVDMADPPTRSSSHSSRSLPAPARIGPSADVWSLAMVMAEILTGEVPFDSTDYRRMTVDEFQAALLGGARPVFPQWVEGQVPWLTALIRRAWSYRAAERCDSVELLACVQEAMAEQGLHC